MEKKMINLTINGIPVSAPEGTTILEAARSVVIRIPSLCFLKDANEIGACRIGTRRLYELLCKITDGNGTMEDLDTIEELCYHLKSSALCALGQSAPNPVLSTLKYFREEYEAHIKEKRCPAGVCKKLITYTIDPAKCKGCTLCLRNCPVGAITGSVKSPHVIDNATCVKCGQCIASCRFNAISKY